MTAGLTTQPIVAQSPPTSLIPTYDGRPLLPAPRPLPGHLSPRRQPLRARLLGELRIWAWITAACVPSSIAIAASILGGAA